MKHAKKTLRIDLTSIRTDLFLLAQSIHENMTWNEVHEAKRQIRAAWEVITALQEELD